MISQLTEFLAEKKCLFPLDPNPGRHPLLTQVKPVPEYISFFRRVLSFRKWWVLLQQLQRECPIILLTERVSKDFASTDPLYSIC